MKFREYKNYDEYIHHQTQKLSLETKGIKIKDKYIEDTVYERYVNNLQIKSKSILCLAARLGGEVRAFKKMGALSIGIDIEPGNKNSDVLYGDFHNIKFADKTFDFIFSNSIDHVLYLDKYLSESKRVLKDDGTFILELKIQKAGKYEVIDTQDINPIIDIIKKHFKIDSEINDIKDWKILFLKK